MSSEDTTIAEFTHQKTHEAMNQQIAELAKILAVCAKTDEFIVKAIDEIKDKKLPEIIDQTRKTNGRVTTLEDGKVNSLLGWRIAMATGGSIIIFLLLYFGWAVQSALSKLANLDQVISISVDKKFAEIDQVISTSIDKKFAENRDSIIKETASATEKKLSDKYTIMIKNSQ